MPPAIGGIATAFGLVGAAKVGLGFAASAILSIVSEKLFAPNVESAAPNLFDVSRLSRSAVEYRKHVYGQALVSGPLTYHNKTTVGSDEFIWYVVTLCEGEIDDLVEVHIDDQVIPVADISWTAGENGADGTGTGDVSTAFYVGDNSDKALQIYWAKGHDDQVAMSQLTSAFTQWTSDHRGRGVAYIVVKCKYNTNTEEIWRGGFPQNIAAVVRGSKLYDSRKDSTNGGSGTHRYTDDSTWEWFDEPALALSSYQQNVMGVSPSAAIDWSSVAAAANFNEATVTIPSSTEKRFTANGAISEGSTHRQNLLSILSSFDGKLSYTGGQWKQRASQWEAASATLTEANFYGPIEVLGSSEYRNRKNTIRGTFVDPDRNYSPVEFPLTSVNTYVTRDAGETLEDEIVLPLTNTDTMAQRLGFRLLDQYDNQKVVKSTLDQSAADIAVGDVVDVTHSKFGWTNKTFRIIEWQPTGDTRYDVTMREDDSADYADPVSGDYGTKLTGGIDFPTGTIPAPMSLSAASVPYAVKLSWTNPPAGSFEFVDVYASSTDAWSGAEKIASVRGDTYTHSLTSGETRYYWVRAVGRSGEESDRFPNSDTSTVQGTSSSNETPVQLAGDMLSDVLVTSNDAEVSYRINSDGNEESYEGDGGTYVVIGPWLLEGAAGDYEVELTVDSGTNPSSGDSLATKLACSTSRSWTWTDTDTAGSEITASCTVKLFKTLATDPIATATLTVNVQKQPPAESLSGTSLSPNVALDFALAPNTAVGTWTFRADGTVDRTRGTTTTQFQPTSEWIIPNNPSATYYIRAQANAGDNPDSGPTLNTWVALSIDRAWSWTQSTNGNKNGSIRVDIATDSGGTNIVATGYYGANLSREP